MGQRRGKRENVNVTEKQQERNGEKKNRGMAELKGREQE